MTAVRLRMTYVRGWLETGRAKVHSSVTFISSFNLSLLILMQVVLTLCFCVESGCDQFAFPVLVLFCRELEQKLKSDIDLNPKVNKNVMRIKNIERTRQEQFDVRLL